MVQRFSILLNRSQYFLLTSNFSKVLARKIGFYLKARKDLVSKFNARKIPGLHCA